MTTQLLIEFQRQIVEWSTATPCSASGSCTPRLERLKRKHHLTAHRMICGSKCRHLKTRDADYFRIFCAFDRVRPNRRRTTAWYRQRWPARPHVQSGPHRTCAP